LGIFIAGTWLVELGGATLYVLASIGSPGRYQRVSDPLEKAVDSVIWSEGEVVLCRDIEWACVGCPCRPSSRVPEQLSLREIDRVDKDELKLALMSPFRVKGRLLV